MSLLSPIFAQAAPATENLTVGGLITGLMFLLTAFGSLGMIVIWVVRYGQTGHALPAAQRGVLRVPLALMIVAILLSALLMVLVLISAIVPEPVPVGVGSATAAATVETQAADTGTTDAPESGADVAESKAATSSDSASTASETATTDAEDSASPPQKKSKLTPAQMKNALTQTIGMDLIMFLAFGAVILIASRAGRVRPRDETDQHRKMSQPAQATSNIPPRFLATGFGSREMWPDLDDASSIPTIPGYGVLGNRPAVPSAPAAPVSAAGAAGEAVQAGASPVEGDPFEYIDDHQQVPGNQWTSERPSTPDEPFSFLTELRFAAEVFLAAYVPTTVLRLIIVMISIAISGETPASHPFLEMLNSGISVVMLAMILVTAVFFAPIVEELQFRVVILGGIAQLGQPGIALAVSSFLFAFAHGFPDSIALIPLALALGYAYLRRRSYVTVMLVHFLFNGFNMVLALVAML